MASSLKQITRVDIIALGRIILTRCQLINSIRKLIAHMYIIGIRHKVVKNILFLTINAFTTAVSIAYRLIIPLFRRSKEYTGFTCSVHSSVRPFVCLLVRSTTWISVKDILFKCVLVNLSSRVVEWRKLCYMLTGLTNMTSCPLCDAGKYCDAPGLLSPRGECDPGFLCYSGATTSGPTDGTTGEICPAGGYCVAGKSWKPLVSPAKLKGPTVKIWHFLVSITFYSSLNLFLTLDFL